MQTAKKTFPGAGKFDPINSTYRQEIYFNNGKSIVGYSKGLLIAEVEDKIVCLEKFILRMYHAGYFNPHRVLRLEYYRQAKLLQERELVVTLYPTHYAFGENAMYLTNKRLNEFLVDLYRVIKDGKDTDKVIVHKPMYTSEEEIFSLKHMRFKTHEELMEFILEKSKGGAAPGKLHQYYLDYCKRFF